MVIITFPDEETEAKALGMLAGRFSGRTWRNGETMVPESALAFLGSKGIPFEVIA